jgi:hypothetical protein
MSGSNELSRADLYAGIREVLVSAQTQARRAVNNAMVQAYWQVGRLIVEDEMADGSRLPFAPSLSKGRLHIQRACSWFDRLTTNSG